VKIAISHISCNKDHSNISSTYDLLLYMI